MTAGFTAGNVFELIEAPGAKTKVKLLARDVCWSLYAYECVNSCLVATGLGSALTTTPKEDQDVSAAPMAPTRMAFEVTNGVYGVVPTRSHELVRSMNKQTCAQNARCTGTAPS